MALLAAKMLRLTILSSPSFVSICLGGIVMLLCVCVCVRARACVYGYVVVAYFKALHFLLDTV